MLRTLLCTSAIAAIASTGLAAQAPAARTFDALRESVSQAQTMRGVIELRTHLLQSAASSRQTSDRSLALVSRKAMPGVLRRERRPELGPSHLVIVVLGQQGEELDWRIVADPRVGRVEWTGADGHLTGQVITNANAALRIVIPDLPGAVRVRIYQPSASEDGNQLTSLGELALQ